MKIDNNLRYNLNQIKKNIAQKYGTSKMIDAINIILNESSTEQNLIEAAADLTLLVDSNSREAVEAVSLLGTCYLKGIGVAKDEKLTFELFTRAAEKGYARAQCVIGHLYENGIGVPRNKQRSHASYTLAKEQGYPLAHYHFGYIYSNGVDGVKEKKLAAEQYTLAAEQGFPPAQHNLGVFYRDGIGVAKDIKRAVELFSLAADQGFSHAQGQLGINYKLGLGVAQDKLRGQELCTLAVEQGCAETQRYLGYDYWNGTGVLKNSKRGMLLTQAAAKQGNALAESNLKGMYDEDRNQFYPDLENAAAYYDSCKQEDPTALTTLAYCYQMGLGGVSQNIKKAIELYNEALKKNISCHSDLYRCFRILSSKGETKPLSEFYQTIKQAHEKGNEKASLFLAYLHEYGAPGLPDQNLFTAHQCYLSASKKKPASKSTQDLKEIKKNMENREIEFQIVVDTVGYANEKLNHFTPLFIMQGVIEGSGIIRGVANIIAEYAFEEDRETDFDFLLR